MTKPTKVAKVPVIMQMEALECGAACLAMILAYYGRWLPLEQVRRDSGVSRDGSNARDLLLAARNYNMNAKILRAEPDQLRQADVFPCIIHWNFNHFVVLNGFSRGKAVINDPARGLVSIPEEEFDRSFTGILIGLNPGEGFVREGKPRSVLEYARKRMQGSEAAFVFVSVTALLTALLGIVNPIFSRIFMDRLLTGRNPEWLIPFVVAMGLIALIAIVVQFFEARYRFKMEGKMALVADSKFVWHVLRLPVEFFSQRRVGDIANRQGTNAGISSTLVNTFAPLLLEFAMVIFYLVVMIRYSAVLTAAVLISMLVKTVTARLISKKRINIMRVMNRDAGKLASSTVSGIEMIETIKSSGAESGYFEQWAGYQASVNTQQVKFIKLNQYLGALPNVIASLADITVLVLGTFMIMQGNFTIGMVLAFQGFLSSVVTPADKLISAGQQLQEMRTNMERIDDVLNYPTDVSDQEDIIDEDVTYTKLSGQMELRNISFGYSPLAEPLIKNFSLKLESGGSVAFVGPSGCGKSTLAKLISGLYQPWSGDILFDGQPAAEIPRCVKTGSIAVVDQDIVLFNDSIRNNIKMWDTSIEDFEMILAARDAQLHEDVMQREGGYNYIVSEGGRDFSGGQRQRMEIARVLAADPTIIILDEATSALDARTEYNVVRSIRDRGVTSIVVAHRLSTIRDADEIIVMDHGLVVERGSHEELYASGGLYTQLLSNE
ncbi:MAG: NHLP family bacteriocin export ABC transporter peptidase/permease/ATPase subunit [Clostridiaceae bacterium]|nr:NHLP family bacteriocin export ABC transporter peptidase/permease/ATPase subunit [Clostridiaceae bacterium]